VSVSHISTSDLHLIFFESEETSKGGLQLELLKRAVLRHPFPILSPSVCSLWVALFKIKRNFSHSSNCLKMLLLSLQAKNTFRG